MLPLGLGRSDANGPMPACHALIQPYTTQICVLDLAKTSLQPLRYTSEHRQKDRERERDKNRETDRKTETTDVTSLYAIPAKYMVESVAFR